jgi:hypothetical protein
MAETCDLGDPWRRYMRLSAERLRRLDERLFQDQIAKIEECLRRDAEWNLEYALESCDRWSAPATPTACEIR